MSTRYLYHLLYAFFLAPYSINAVVCRFPGPALPTLGLTASHPGARSLSAELTALLDSGIKDDPALSKNTTSFSFSITSKKETIFQYHHTADVLAVPRKKKVDGDSVYRIASVSKVFTVFAALIQKNLSLEDPITKWLPELGKGRSVVDWKDIKLKDLAGMTAGLPRQFLMQDLFNDFMAPGVGKPEDYGLPTLQKSDLPACGNDKMCTLDEYLKLMKTIHPAFNPGDKSTYSNDGLALFGHAVGSAARETWERVVEKKIFHALGMKHSFTTKPADELGVIPISDRGKSDWDFDNGLWAPTGGIYMSPNDLTKFVRSILENQLLSPAETRRWLKPSVFTVSTKSAVGMPWEIMRFENITNDGRVIDVYSKAGGFNGYYSWIYLIPEYEIGATILTAGPSTTVGKLQEIFIAKALPIIEKITREEASKTLAGTYKAKNSLNSTITLTLDNGPGLHITNWISNGTDLLDAFGMLTRGTAIPKTRLDLRMSPTGVSRDGGKAWRIVRAIMPFSDIPDTQCWTDIDGMVYGGESLLEMVFIPGKNGPELFSPALRARFTKAR